MTQTPPDKGSQQPPKGERPSDNAKNLEEQVKTNDAYRYDPPGKNNPELAPPGQVGTEKKPELSAEQKQHLMFQALKKRQIAEREAEYLKVRKGVAKAQAGVHLAKKDFDRSK